MSQVRWLLGWLLQVQEHIELVRERVTLYVEYIDSSDFLTLVR